MKWNSIHYSQIKVFILYLSDFFVSTCFLERVLILNISAMTLNIEVCLNHKKKRFSKMEGKQFSIGGRFQNCFLSGVDTQHHNLNCYYSQFKGLCRLRTKIIFIMKNYDFLKKFSLLGMRV